MRSTNRYGTFRWKDKWKKDYSGYESVGPVSPIMKSFCGVKPSDHTRDGKIVDLDCRDIQNPDCMSYEAIWVVDGKYGIA